MAIKPIYLEPDEEITSVVDRIEKTDGSQLALVVPKNSTLFQSMVNLKLIAKQAKESDKTVVIISNNKVGQRLAKQVGLASYANLGTTPQKEDKAVAEKPESKPTVEAKTDEETLPDGTKIHRYVPPTGGEEPIGEPEPQVESGPEETETEAEPVLDPEQLHEPAEPVAVASDKDEPTKIEHLASQPAVDEPESSTAHGEHENLELPTIVSRSAPREPFNWRTGIPWKSVISSAVLLLLALIITVIFLPKAQVKVTFPAKLISQTVSFNVKTAADDQPSTLVGNLLSVDKTVTTTVTATGKKDIGSKATGQVTITNKYKDANGAGKDESFAAGTIITDTKTKKTFSLDSAVSVGKVTYDPNTGQPSYQSKMVAVTATSAGADFNLSPSSFSADGVLANTTIENSAAFSGGVTKQVTILSQDDINKAYADLEKQAIDQATTDLKAKADKQTLLDGSLFQNVTDKSVDQAVNAQVDKATATAKATVSALVFDGNQAQDKIKTELEKQLSANEQLEIPDDKTPTLTFKSLSDDKSSMTIESAAQGYAVAKINKTELAHQVVRKSVEQARQLIKDSYQAEAVDIAVTPGWWPKRLPLLSHAISVDYGFDVVSH